MNPNHISDLVAPPAVSGPKPYFEDGRPVDRAAALRALLIKGRNCPECGRTLVDDGSPGLACPANHGRLMEPRRGNPDGPRGFLGALVLAIWPARTHA
ncbi:MAG: hypothetical protein ABFD60_01540 [Bryobacteraceae bacterium]